MSHCVSAFVSGISEDRHTKIKHNISDICNSKDTLIPVSDMAMKTTDNILCLKGRELAGRRCLNIPSKTGPPISALIKLCDALPCGLKECLFLGTEAGQSFSRKDK